MKENILPDLVGAITLLGIVIAFVWIVGLTTLKRFASYMKNKVRNEPQRIYKREEEDTQEDTEA